MLYSWIGLPVFSMMIVGISGVECIVMEKSKVLRYFGKISYVFFLAQLFSNTICKKIIQFFEIEGNLARIFIGWIVCIVIAILFHEIFEKPIVTYLKNKIAKRLS